MEEKANGLFMAAGLIDFGRLHVMLSKNIMDDGEFADGKERRTNRIIFTSDADWWRIFYSLLSGHRHLSLSSIIRPYRYLVLILCPIASRKLK